MLAQQAIPTVRCLVSLAKVLVKSVALVLFDHLVEEKCHLHLLQGKPSPVAQNPNACSSKIR